MKPPRSLPFSSSLSPLFSLSLPSPSISFLYVFLPPPFSGSVNGSQYPGGDKGVRGFSPSPCPSFPECGTAAFQNPAAPTHSSTAPPPHPPPPPRHPPSKKSGYLLEYLFCIVPRRTKDVHYVRNKPPFLSKRETITWNCLFFSPFFFLESIINVISSCLCPSVCIGWVWAPGTDGLGTRAAADCGGSVSRRFLHAALDWV